MENQLAAAYQACRNIARAEAKNFYYAFLALPKHKSDAMCAIYAFMRKADDLADDESMTIEARRTAMSIWMEEWQHVRSGASTTDVIFLALRDTQQRFGISDELLAQLVQGTTMDLYAEQQPGIASVTVTKISTTGAVDRGEYEVYETFDALYRYCYLVASVVGLVCIRIFGYTDTRAELLAEKTGVAFQLTNILRDVREDAERGRIYLPLDEMAATQTSLEDIVNSTRQPEHSSPVLPLIQREIVRAKELYLASDELIPLLDKDSRAAMQVLAAIYRRLLDRIAADPAAIFRTRVSVPTATKLGLLGKGMVASFINRMTA